MRGALYHASVRFGGVPDLRWDRLPAAPLVDVGADRKITAETDAP